MQKSTQGGSITRRYVYINIHWRQGEQSFPIKMHTMLSIYAHMHNKSNFKANALNDYLDKNFEDLWA